MGTSDIYIDFDDGNWDPAEWADYNPEDATYEQISNYIKLSETVAYRACAIKKSILRSTPSGEWFLYAQVQPNLNSASTNTGFTIHVKIGSAYFKVGNVQLAGVNKLLYEKSTTQPTVPVTRDGENTEGNIVSTSYTHYIGLRFNADKTTDLVYKYPPTIPDWQVRETSIGNWEDELITEIGVTGDINYIDSSNAAALFQLWLEADSYDIATGGTAVIQTPILISVNKGLHGISSGVMKFTEKYLENYSDHKDNHGKIIDIYTKNGYHLMHSEVRHSTIIGKEITYTLKPYDLKLTDIMVGLNPLETAIVIRCLDWKYAVDECVLRDKDLTFDPAWIGKMAVFLQSNDKKLVYNFDFTEWIWTGPSDWDSEQIPTDEDGDMEYTYFQDTSTDNSLDGYNLSSNEQGIGLISQSNIFIKDGSLPTKITIDLIFSTRPLFHYSLVGNDNYPIIEAYNYNTTTWDELYQVSDSDLSGGTRWSKKEEDDNFGYSEGYNLTVKIDIETDMSHYLDLQDNADFDQYTMKVRIKVSAVPPDGTVVHHTLHLYYATISITLDVPAISEYSQGYISNVYVISKYLKFNILGYLPVLPSQDGISNNDTMYIVDNLEDLIDTINAANSFDYEIDHDITNGDQITLFNDLTYVSYLQFLNQIAKLTNAVWWVSDPDKKIYIKTIDNLEDSGLTIQLSDIKYGRDGLIYDEDSTLLKNKIVLQGKGVTYEKATNPEYALSADEETKVLKDPTLDTQDKVTSAINELYPVYESVHKLMKFSLDLDLYNWGNARLGKLITVQIPSTGVPTLDFSGSDKLLIYKVEFLKELGVKGKETIVLWLQRRFY